MTKKNKARDKYYRLKYGITLRDYNWKLSLQGGKCAICKKPPRTKRLAVDHNHKTGRVRGLLCFYCNKRIVGRHTIETVEKLYGYLVRYDVRYDEDSVSLS